MEKDNWEQRFDKVVEKLGVQNKPKRLVTEKGELIKEFEANGNKYAWMPPDQCFNIVRKTMFHNINTAFALNQTPFQIRKRFAESKDTIIKIMGAKGAEWNKLMEKLLRDSLNNLDSFKGTYTSRYGAAFYICTLFIIKEGEDLSNWTWELANDKINDWVEANLCAVDFFSLARTFCQDYEKIMKENSEDKDMRRVAESSGDLET